MNQEELIKMFGGNVITVDVGDDVICDYCSEDFTNSNQVGGFILSGDAICPNCAERTWKLLKKHNEERYLKAICKENESFADFVRNYRKMAYV